MQDERKIEEQPFPAPLLIYGLYAYGDYHSCEVQILGFREEGKVHLNEQSIKTQDG